MLLNVWNWAWNWNWGLFSGVFRRPLAVFIAVAAAVLAFAAFDVESAQAQGGQNNDVELKLVTDRTGAIELETTSEDRFKASAGVSYWAYVRVRIEGSTTAVTRGSVFITHIEGNRLTTAIGCSPLTVRHGLAAGVAACLIPADQITEAGTLILKAAYNPEAGMNFNTQTSELDLPVRISATSITFLGGSGQPTKRATATAQAGAPFTVRVSVRARTINREGSSDAGVPSSAGYVTLSGRGIVIAKGQGCTYDRNLSGVYTCTATAPTTGPVTLNATFIGKYGSDLIKDYLNSTTDGKSPNGGALTLTVTPRMTDVELKLVESPTRVKELTGHWPEVDIPTVDFLYEAHVRVLVDGSNTAVASGSVSITHVGGAPVDRVYRECNELKGNGVARCFIPRSQFSEVGALVLRAAYTPARGTNFNAQTTDLSLQVRAPTTSITFVDGSGKPTNRATATAGGKFTVRVGVQAVTIHRTGWPFRVAVRPGAGDVTLTGIGSRPITCTYERAKVYIHGKRATVYKCDVTAPAKAGDVQLTAAFAGGNGRDTTKDYQDSTTDIDRTTPSGPPLTLTVVDGPKIVSIERRDTTENQAVTNPLTNATSITWLVTFSEDVNVEENAFLLAAGGATVAQTPTNPAVTSGNTVLVTAATKDNQQGEVGLAIDPTKISRASNANIKLSPTLPAADADNQKYTVDRVAPTYKTSPDSVAVGDTITFTMDFDEDMQSNPLPSISSPTAGITLGTVTHGGNSNADKFTAQITVPASFSGTSLAVEIGNLQNVKDLAGNPASQSPAAKTATLTVTPAGNENVELKLVESGTSAKELAQNSLEANKAAVSFNYFAFVRVQRTTGNAAVTEGSVFITHIGGTALTSAIRCSRLTGGSSVAAGVAICKIPGAQITKAGTLALKTAYTPAPGTKFNSQTTDLDLPVRAPTTLIDFQIHSATASARAPFTVRVRVRAITTNRGGATLFGNIRERTAGDVTFTGIGRDPITCTYESAGIYKCDAIAPATTGNVRLNAKFTGSNGGDGTKDYQDSTTSGQRGNGGPLTLTVTPALNEDVDLVLVEGNRSTTELTTSSHDQYKAATGIRHFAYVHVRKAGADNTAVTEGSVSITHIGGSALGPAIRCSRLTGISGVEGVDKGIAKCPIPYNRITEAGGLTLRASYNPEGALFTAKTKDLSLPVKASATYIRFLDSAGSWPLRRATVKAGAPFTVRVRVTPIATFYDRWNTGSIRREAAGTVALSGDGITIAPNQGCTFEGFRKYKCTATAPAKAGDVKITATFTGGNGRDTTKDYKDSTTDSSSIPAGQFQVHNDPPLTLRVIDELQITKIERLKRNPLTNAEEIKWLVWFNASVNVEENAFSLAMGGATVAQNLTNGRVNNVNVAYVTASTIDNREGDVGLTVDPTKISLASNRNIKLASATPTGANEKYTVDRIVPRFTTSPDSLTAGEINTFTVDFDEDMQPTPLPEILGGLPVRGVSHGGESDPDKFTAKIFVPTGIRDTSMEFIIRALYNVKDLAGNPASTGVNDTRTVTLTITPPAAKTDVELVLVTGPDDPTALNTNIPANQATVGIDYTAYVRVQKTATGKAAVAEGNISVSLGGNTLTCTAGRSNYGAIHNTFIHNGIFACDIPGTLITQAEKPLTLSASYNPGAAAFEAKTEDLNLPVRVSNTSIEFWNAQTGGGSRVSAPIMAAAGAEFPVSVRVRMTDGKTGTTAVPVPSTAGSVTLRGGGITNPRCTYQSNQASPGQATGLYTCTANAPTTGSSAEVTAIFTGSNGGDGIQDYTNSETGTTDNGENLTLTLTSAREDVDLVLVEGNRSTTELTTSSHDQYKAATGIPHFVYVHVRKAGADNTAVTEGSVSITRIGGTALGSAIRCSRLTGISGVEGVDKGIAKCRIPYNRITEAGSLTLRASYPENPLFTAKTKDLSLPVKASATYIRFLDSAGRWPLRRATVKAGAPFTVRVRVTPIATFYDRWDTGSIRREAAGTVALSGDGITIAPNQGCTFEGFGKYKCTATAPATTGDVKLTATFTGGNGGDGTKDYKDSTTDSSSIPAGQFQVHNDPPLTLTVTPAAKQDVELKFVTFVASAIELDTKNADNQPAVGFDYRVYVRVQQTATGNAAVTRGSVSITEIGGNQLNPAITCDRLNSRGVAGCTILGSQITEAGTLDLKAAYDPGTTAFEAKEGNLSLPVRAPTTSIEFSDATGGPIDSATATAGAEFTVRVKVQARANFKWGPVVAATPSEAAGSVQLSGIEGNPITCTYEGEVGDGGGLLRKGGMYTCTATAPARGSVRLNATFTGGNGNDTTRDYQDSTTDGKSPNGGALTLTVNPAAKTATTATFVANDAGAALSPARGANPELRPDSGNLYAIYVRVAEQNNPGTAVTTGALKVTKIANVNKDINCSDSNNNGIFLCQIPYTDFGSSPGDKLIEVAFAATQTHAEVTNSQTYSVIAPVTTPDVEIVSIKRKTPAGQHHSAAISSEQVIFELSFNQPVSIAAGAFASGNAAVANRVIDSDDESSGADNLVSVTLELTRQEGDLHLDIADRARITARSAPSKSLTQKSITDLGAPAANNDKYQIYTIDNTQPTIASVEFFRVQQGGAVESTATDNANPGETVGMVVTFSEDMQATPVPTVILPTNNPTQNGFTAVTLAPVSGDNTKFSADISVPSGITSDDYTFTVNANGALDRAGNPATGTPTAATLKVAPAKQASGVIETVATFVESDNFGASPLTSPQNNVSASDNYLAYVKVATNPGNSAVTTGTVTLTGAGQQITCNDNDPKNGVFECEVPQDRITRGAQLSLIAQFTGGGGAYSDSPQSSPLILNVVDALRITKIERWNTTNDQAVTNPLTNAASITWLVTFSANVNIAASDAFSLTGTTTVAQNLTNSRVNNVNIAYVTASTIDNREGDVGLTVDPTKISLASNANIKLASATPTGANEKYMVDRVAPTYTTSPDSFTAGDKITFTLDFDEDMQSTPVPTIRTSVAGVAVGDVSHGGGSNADQFTAEIIVPVDFSGASLAVNIGNLTQVKDLAGNPASQSTAAQTATLTVTPDKARDGEQPAPLTILKIERSPQNTPQLTNADTLKWLVTFSRPVHPISSNDFSVDGPLKVGSPERLRPADMNLTVSNRDSNAGILWEVTASGGGLSSFNGEALLGLSQGQTIRAKDNNSVLTWSAPPATYQTYKLDNAGPKLLSVRRVSKLLHGRAPVVNGKPQLVWRLAFSEKIVGMNTNLFEVQGSTATITRIEPVGELEKHFDIIAEGGDLQTVSGEVTLQFSSDFASTIKDTVGNGYIASHTPSRNERSYIIRPVPEPVPRPLTVALLGKIVDKKNAELPSGKSTSCTADTKFYIKTRFSFTPDGKSQKATIYFYLLDGRRRILGAKVWRHIAPTQGWTQWLAISKQTELVGDGTGYWNIVAAKRDNNYRLGDIFTDNDAILDSAPFNVRFVHPNCAGGTGAGSRSSDIFNIDIIDRQPLQSLGNRQTGLFGAAKSNARKHGQRRNAGIIKPAALGTIGGGGGVSGESRERCTPSRQPLPFKYATKITYIDADKTKRRQVRYYLIDGAGKIVGIRSRNSIAPTSDGTINNPDNRASIMLREQIRLTHDDHDKDPTKSWRIAAVDYGDQSKRSTWGNVPEEEFDYLPRPGEPWFGQPYAVPAFGKELDTITFDASALYPGCFEIETVSEDLALSTSAALAATPATITIKQEVRAGTSKLRPDAAFGFSSKKLGAFSLTTKDGKAERTFTNLQSGTYTITADDLSIQGYTLKQINCSTGGAGNVNNKSADITLASTSISCTFVSEFSPEKPVRHAKQMIADYLGARNVMLLAHQPDKNRRIKRLNGQHNNPDPNGTLNASFSKPSMSLTMNLKTGAPVDVRMDNKSVSFASSLSRFGLFGSGLGRLSGQDAPPNRWDVWTQGYIARFDDTSSSGGRFGIVHGGIDYIVTPDTLIGLALQYDWFKQKYDRNGASIDGHGWMLGPYATMRFGNNLYLDAHALWGRSSNDITPFGTYTDSFTTTRWLSGATLSGEFAYDPWTFTPSLSLEYIGESQHAYTSKTGAYVSGQTISQGQLRLAPRISYEYKLDEINSTLTPWFEFQGAYTFGRRGQFSDGSLASDIHGLSGGIEAGFDFRMASGASLSLSGTYDGIGSDYESYGARLRLDLPF